MKLPFEKIYDSDLVHPAEEETERECQKNSLYHWLARESSALTNRVDARAEAALRRYPVTAKTAPRPNRLYEQVLRRLDCPERYPLFLKYDYEIRTEVTGSNSDDHIITLSSAAAEEIEDDELTALLAQAVGRIRTNHAQNLQMIKFLQSGVGTLPLVGALAEKKLWGSFAEWIIAAQFTEDRFALHACGSEHAVASLLLKQNGLNYVDVKAAVNQPVKKFGNLGVYFVWLANSLTHFDAIERIQELRKWIRSEKFRKTYPGFYYRLKLERGDLEDSAEAELHRLAADNNLDALTELTQLYLRGNENLPRSLFMVTELSKAAAFLGDAESMHLFAMCMERNGKFDEKVVHRLYEAAFSRGFEPAREKISHESVAPSNNFVTSLCDDFAAVYRNRTACKLNFADDDARKVRNAFWMNSDEKIFALEIFFDANDSIFGTAITESGIFGRLSENSLPYFVSWSALKIGNIYRKNRLLMCNDTKLCRVETDLCGTAGELIVRLAHKLRS